MHGTIHSIIRREFISLAKEFELSIGLQEPERDMQLQELLDRANSLTAAAYREKCEPLAGHIEKTLGKRGIVLEASRFRGTFDSHGVGYESEVSYFNGLRRFDDQLIVKADEDCLILCMPFSDLVGYADVKGYEIKTNKDLKIWMLEPGEAVIPGLLNESFILGEYSSRFQAYESMSNLNRRRIPAFARACQVFAEMLWDCEQDADTSQDGPLSRKQWMHHGKPVSCHLSPQAFKLAKLLYSNDRRQASFDEIGEEVFDDDLFETKQLRDAASKLSKAIKPFGVKVETCEPLRLCSIVKTSERR